MQLRGKAGLQVSNASRLAAKGKALPAAPGQGKGAASAAASKGHDWVAGMVQARKDLELAGARFAAAYGPEHPTSKMMQPWVKSCTLSLLGTAH